MVILTKKTEELLGWCLDRLEEVDPLYSSSDKIAEINDHFVELEKNKKEVKFFRFDRQENSYEEPTDFYDSEEKVIEDATRFYHEHFADDGDYDENFEVKTFDHAIEFWDCNDYMILQAEEICPEQEEEPEE